MNTITKTKNDTKMTSLRNAQYKQKVTLSSWRQIHKRQAQEKQWMQSYAATFPCDCTSPGHLLLASRHSVLPRSLPLLFSVKKNKTTTKCGFNLWKQLIVSRWRIHWLIFPSCLIKYFQKNTEKPCCCTSVGFQC